MPFISLDVKCSMVAVDQLAPMDPESFRWHIKVKCTNCGEAPEKWHYVVINEMLEMPGSRGEANLVEKCKLCSRVNTLTILPDSVGKYLLEKNEKWQSLLTFDCRGIEPFDFDPRNNWTAVGSESSTVFDDIDLSEKSWADYDEQANEATEITDFEVKFSAVKGKK